MGARGINARAKIEGYVEPAHPWDDPNLSQYEKAVLFIESLPISSGVLAGKQVKLLPFQKAWLKKLFRTGKDGRRIVRTGILSVPRRNGKTFLSAALVLAFLAGPFKEERGCILGCANSQKQASLLFDEVAALVHRIEWLDQRINIQSHTKTMTDLPTESTYKAISNKVEQTYGYSCSMYVIDEVGFFKDDAMIQALETSCGSRSQPLGLLIGTQAPNDEAVFSKKIDYCKRVEAGEVKDPSVCMTLISAPVDADIFDEKVWKKYNPAIGGKYRSLEDVRAQARRVKEIPSTEGGFRNLILNERISAVQGFIPQRLWKACAGTAEETGPCFGGLDLSFTRDLTAFVLYWPETGAVRCWAFLPSVGLAEKAHEDAVPYLDWERRGYLLATNGKTIDQRFVAGIVAQACKTFDVRAIGFDRWGMTALSKTIESELGLDPASDLHLVPHGQGYKDMGPAVDSLERRLIDESFRHGSNPILNWTASNVIATTDPAGARKFDKAKSRGRIDPIVALAMACHEADIHMALDEKISKSDAESMVFSWE